MLLQRPFLLPILIRGLPPPFGGACTCEEITADDDAGSAVDLCCRQPFPPSVGGATLNFPKLGCNKYCTVHCIYRYRDERRIPYQMIKQTHAFSVAWLDRSLRFLQFLFCHVSAGKGAWKPTAFVRNYPPSYGFKYKFQMESTIKQCVLLDQK